MESIVPALMVQGTGSHVGKSLIVAGLARAFADRGLRVRPFKPQNMSNNAGVAEGGGEIGRAQMLQARAARVPASVHMNPVLLKPETETGAQVIVQGRRWASMTARQYGRRKHELMPSVLDSFTQLSVDADLVLVEGAGSPAEINLRTGDIANMGFAEAADLPVVLVGDIHRGGVIASLVGTHTILPRTERMRVRGFIVNRFRGDPSLFADGMSEIARRTDWPALGLVPYFPGAARLPAEDVLGLEEGRRPGAAVKIAMPQLSRIANFDDLDPLRMEPAVDLEVVPPGRPLPGDADLVLLPGSKSTIGDLEALRREGWDTDIFAHIRRGGRVLGICGGYQMLGRTISDPEGVEGSPRTVAGLGLIEAETVLSPLKTTVAVTARHCASGAPLAGYEIHMGRTTGPDCARAFAEIGGRPDGAVSADGRAAGTYVHGLFASNSFRAAFLAELGAPAGMAGYDAAVESALDGWAGHLAAHLDLDAVMAIARARTRAPAR